MACGFGSYFDNRELLTYRRSSGSQFLDVDFEFMAALVNGLRTELRSVLFSLMIQ